MLRRLAVGIRQISFLTKLYDKDAFKAFTGGAEFEIGKS
jgi:hypothetical protein